jgi:hypothetical protein
MCLYLCLFCILSYAYNLHWHIAVEKFLNGLKPSMQLQLDVYPVEHLPGQHQRSNHEQVSEIFKQYYRTTKQSDYNC